MNFGVSRVERSGNFTTVVLKDNTEFFCKDILGALSWPTAGSPGYYLIAAIRNQSTDAGKPILSILAEGENPLPTEFFKSLLVAGRKLWCRIFFADLGSEKLEIVSLFDDYQRYHAGSQVRVERAAFTNNFEFSLGLVKEWSKALEIPKMSILRKQLGQISLNDLGERPEDRFYAVNALRLLIGSIERDPPKNNFWPSQRSPPHYDGWT